jgi:hypothetical protein
MPFSRPGEGGSQFVGHRVQAAAETRMSFGLDPVPEGVLEGHRGELCDQFGRPGVHLTLFQGIAD